MTILKEIYDNFDVLQLKPEEKTPAVPTWEALHYKRPSESEWINHKGNYGIICGSRSRNLEVIDFDIKNWQEPDCDMMKEYKHLVKEQGGLKLLASLMIIKTPSGGFHFLYRSKKIEGNKVLARTKDRKTIIETRGEGGYICTVPSKGYAIVQGSFESIPVINEEDRALLLDSAMIMNQYVDYDAVTARTKKDYGKIFTGKPESLFNKFNRDVDFRELLERNGWTFVKPGVGGALLYKRPDDGIATESKTSASLFVNHENLPILYVFSTNTKLEANKPHTAVDFLVAYECAGDLKKAKSIIESMGYGDGAILGADKVKKYEKITFNELLDKNRISDTTDIPPLVPIVNISGIVSLSRGNLMTVGGIAKVGKSAIVNSIIAKALDPLCPGFGEIDVEKVNGQAIVHIDTEQSKAKHKDNLVRWILARTTLRALPDNFYSFNFREYNVFQARELLKDILKEVNKNCGGIFMVVIDGISDFMKSINDSEESQMVTKILLEISAIYNCGIISVLHTNQPQNLEFNKLRGHAGSDLERKSESVYLVKKDPDRDRVRMLIPSYLRNGEVDDLKPIYFYYNIEKGRHETMDAGSEETMANRHLEALKKVAECVMGLAKPEAIYRLMERTDLDSKTATAKINECLRLNMLVESQGKLLRVAKEL